MPKRSDTKPWERQEGESVKAYEAFQCYLNLGETRSQRLVSEQLSKSRQLISRWSANYQWVERVAAYENDLQRQAHAEAVKKARQMADRHISIAMKMQQKALQALKEMDPRDIDPKNLVAFIREATKLERENRTEIVKDTNPATGAEAASSSLADVISEAWERRRQQNEPDK
jgi:hypothetical protein